MITLHKGSRFIVYIMNVFFVVSCTTFSLHGMEEGVRESMQQLTINDRLSDKILCNILMQLAAMNNKNVEVIAWLIDTLKMDVKVVTSNENNLIDLASENVNVDEMIKYLWEKDEWFSRFC